MGFRGFEVPQDLLAPLAHLVPEEEESQFLGSTEKTALMGFRFRGRLARKDHLGLGVET